MLTGRFASMSWGRSTSETSPWGSTFRVASDLKLADERVDRGSPRNPPRCLSVPSTCSCQLITLSLGSQVLWKKGLCGYLWCCLLDGRMWFYSHCNDQKSICVSTEWWKWTAGKSGPVGRWEGHARREIGFLHSGPDYPFCFLKTTEQPERGEQRVNEQILMQQTKTNVENLILKKVNKPAEKFAFLVLEPSAEPNSNSVMFYSSPGSEGAVQ